MSPFAMSLLLVVSLSIFAWLIRRRWRLMCIGPDENRWDQLAERLKRTYHYAFRQKRMPRYTWAGHAHRIIFIGFLVLLLRSLILFARGYSREFDAWGLFAHDTILGDGYSFLKDFFAILVILATTVFIYYRVIIRLKRMTLSFEGLLILLIIITMMFADLLYDGSSRVLAGAGGEPAFAWSEPAGSIVSLCLAGTGEGTLRVLAHVGFWTHVSLVLLFLNLLPISKHFHVITAIPNVFTQSLAPRGRLPNVEDIEAKIEREETLGLARIDQMNWKGVLDLYTCTECGRCTDQCPAANTGKKLSPKHLTLDLRDHLYAYEKKLITAGENGTRDLAPAVIDPEVLWACTTCGACETECPVFITYVDKIVDMRRYLVMEKSEFPAELQNA
ncbi:MAG: 4Fe-4S dicluster domain-containing protein, partial [Phycisphaerae bacterium]